MPQPGPMFHFSPAFHISLPVFQQVSHETTYQPWTRNSRHGFQMESITPCTCLGPPQKFPDFQLVGNAPKAAAATAFIFQRHQLQTDFKGRHLNSPMLMTDTFSQFFLAEKTSSILIGTALTPLFSNKKPRLIGMERPCVSTWAAWRTKFP